jgi:hypothetical protein
MAMSALAKKLRFQGAQRALILNGPEGYLEMLGELPEEVQIESKSSGAFDLAHLFVRDHKELDQFIDQVLPAIEYDAILWISYPKGGSGVKTDLNRDSLWEAMTEKGIRLVAQVSIDQVWSAVRFRPSELVGKR